MSSFAIITIFVFIYLVSEFVDLYLLRLNYFHVEAHASQVPEELSEVLSQDELKKSTQYTLAGICFSRTKKVFSCALTLWVVLSGFLGSFEQSILSSFAGLGLGAISIGVIYIVALSFLSMLVDIPFSLYSTFVLEDSFGFNNNTKKGWLIDFFKQLFISLLLIVPLLYALFWVMTVLGESWWIWASALILSFSLLMQLIYPMFIAPLFNKFTPLEGDLKKNILELCKRLDFPLTEVYSIDGSKRSKHSNAYFAGLGKAKRIVLYDTLIESLTTDQLLAVLAHEIGHEKHAHIKKMIFLSAIQTVFIFWLLSLFIDYLPFYTAFGFTEPNLHAALVLFGIFIGPLMYCINPLFSMLLRKHEYEADRFAADAMKSSKPITEALVTLAKDNLSNLWPHPWYSFVHYSHPTLIERMNALKEG